MLKLRELAVQPDFQLGPIEVSPSRRLVEGPAGKVHVEPLIMQALLLLLDARGSVVTRDELFNQCWGAASVGDDSLNRAILKVRRILEEVAPGQVEIETIPRTGYRLTGEIFEDSGCEPSAMRDEAASAQSVSRRRMISGGAAAAALATGSLWWVTKDRTDPRFDALMARGEEALRLDEPDAAKYFEQAVAIEPRKANPWGLFAYSLASGGEQGPLALTGKRAQFAERAARAALEIDPNEPNALLAMTIVQIDILDRIEREQRLRQILAIDPDNTLVMRSLGSMLHSVGRCRESLAVAERAIAIEPLCPDHQLRRAGRLWVLGRVADADQVIDRAMQLWPSHQIVRLMRLMIYAYTGRARAALAMVEDEEENPILLSPEAASVWRASLEALEKPTPSAVAAARAANLDGSKTTPAIAAHAILTLSALGELDAAFDVANGFLLGRGSTIVRPQPTSKVPSNSGPGWRNTFGLFTPPTKAMRLDPRFKPLADGLGLTDYWRKRGIGPDAFLFKA